MDSRTMSQAGPPVAAPEGTRPRGRPVARPSSAVGSADRPAPSAAPRGYGNPEPGRPRQEELAYPPAPPRVRPTPLPKRPKGRWFVGCFLLLIVGGICFTIWDSCFRYRVHGVVAGRLIHVSPPWDGFLDVLHVREGQWVTKGQLLATVRSLNQEQTLARLTDELRMAQADLEARISQLKWESQLRGDRNQKARSEYFELWGELLREQSLLAQAQADWRRLETTAADNPAAVSQRQMDGAKYAVQGRRSQVAQLERAHGELKRRVEIYEQLKDDATAQLRPKVLRIEQLQAEMSRLREMLNRGQVRAPVNGKVVKVLRFTGEYAGVAHTLVELVEDGSLEPVLYLPQQDAFALKRGDQVRVRLDPHSQPLVCTVRGHGHRMENAPNSIQRYYRKDQRLLPVYLRLPEQVKRDPALWIGCEVKMPYRWPTPWAVPTPNEPPSPEAGLESGDQDAGPLVQAPANRF